MCARYPCRTECRFRAAAPLVKAQVGSMRECTLDDTARDQRVEEEVPEGGAREFLIDNLLVRIHFIIVMTRWTGLAPWEFESLFPGSLTSTILAYSKRKWGVCAKALFTTPGLGFRV